MNFEMIKKYSCSIFTDIWHSEKLSKISITNIFFGRQAIARMTLEMDERYLTEGVVAANDVTLWNNNNSSEVVISAAPNIPATKRLTRVEK